jgi:hypothetical protein
VEVGRAGRILEYLALNFLLRTQTGVGLADRPDDHASTSGWDSRTSLRVNVSNPNNVLALRCIELQVQTFFKIIADYRYEKGVGGFRI